MLGLILGLQPPFVQADLGPIQTIAAAHNPSFTGWPFYVDGNCVYLQTLSEILCAYDDDSYGDSTTGGIFLAKSADGGQNWSKPWKLNVSEPRSGYDAYLARRANGELILTYTRGKVETDNVTGHSLLFFTGSKDSGQSWNQPVLIAGNSDPYPNHWDASIAEGPDGRLYVAEAASEDQIANMDSDIRLWTSNDSGKTWYLEGNIYSGPKHVNYPRLLFINSSILVLFDYRPERSPEATASIAMLKVPDIILTGNKIDENEWKDLKTLFSSSTLVFVGYESPGKIRLMYDAYGTIYTTASTDGGKTWEAGSKIFGWRHDSPSWVLTSKGIFYVASDRTNKALVGRLDNSIPVNKAPVAKITASQTAGNIPLTVQVSARDSYDPDGDKLAYYWTFGDDVIRTGLSINYTFQKAGNYTIRLTVSDGALFNTTTISVDATDYLPPAANLRNNCSLSGSQVTVSWDPVIGATSYLLRIDDPSNNAPGAIDGWYVSGSTDLMIEIYDISFSHAVVESRNYSWWVHSRNSSRISNPSTSSFQCVLKNNLIFYHSWTFAQPSGSINVSGFKDSCGQSSQIFYFDIVGKLMSKNSGILNESEYKSSGGIILKAETINCSFSYTPYPSISPTGNWYIISPSADFDVSELDRKCGSYSQAFYFDSNDKLRTKNSGTVSQAEIKESGGLLVKAEKAGCMA
ncbi:MAG: PKD domain-containing protein [Candidatus Aenigmarchaeota archaeon]|nr:PKD domain-containing protein [Candidatus Aenigmarchaeota archaeon]